MCNKNKTEEINKICAGSFKEEYRFNIPFFKAEGIFLKHSSGLEVFHIKNDSSENLFAFSFKTEPTDSTGVPHIMEHSVLCGSKNYPLKDPFAVLANQSVKTYLNAMTTPTHTIFPASSTSKKDYFNLMAVYGDAVFFPLLSKNTFLQEGHRFELDSSGKLVSQGVVFNEMKGVYSSPEGMIATLCTRSLMQGSCFQYDSGGNPADIPKLSYEEFLAFHKEKYVPSNCRVFLYGDIPTETQLEFIEEKFLNAIDSSVQNEKSTEKKSELLPLEYSRIDLDVPGNSEDGYTAFINWRLPMASPKEKIELLFVLNLLIYHEGAPLRKALIESHLGTEVSPYSGIEVFTNPPSFSLGLRGIKNEENIEKFKDFVFKTLNDIVMTGISEEDLQARFCRFEFSNRDLSSATTQVILTLMQDVFDSWNEELTPRDFFDLFEKRSDFIAKEVMANQSYIKSLIQKNLIDNSEYNFIVAKANKDCQAIFEEKFAFHANEKEKNITQKEKHKILKEQKNLEKFISRKDSKKLQKLIPHILVTDLESKLEAFSFVTKKIGNVTCLFQEQPTCGVAIFRLLIPVENVSKDDYAFLTAFAEVFASLGYGDISWSDSSKKQLLYTDSIRSSMCLNDATPLLKEANDFVGRELFTLSTRILYEYLEEGLNLFFELFHNPNFADSSRLKELIVDIKEELEMSMLNAGQSIAISRVRSHFTRQKAIAELWGGAEGLLTLREFAKLSDEELSEKCNSIFSTIKKNGCLVQCTADSKTLEKSEKLLEKHLKPFDSFIALPQNLVYPDFKTIGFPTKTYIPLECIVLPTQISYTALALKGVSVATDSLDEVSAKIKKNYNSSNASIKLCASQKVFANWFEKNILWQEIRMKGGAYGVYAIPCQIDPYIVVSTYRDPKPLESIEKIKNSLFLAKKLIDKDSLEKSITGLYSRETVPLSPQEKSIVALQHFLVGNKFEDRKFFFDSMLSTSVSDVKNIIEVLIDSLDKSFATIVCNENMAKTVKNKKNFVQISNTVI